jgi:hypothetical protein
VSVAVREGAVALDLPDDPASAVEVV